MNTTGEPAEPDTDNTPPSPTSKPVLDATLTTAPSAMVRLTPEGTVRHGAVDHVDSVVRPDLIGT